MDSNFHTKPLTSETGSSESSGRRHCDTDKLQEGPQHRCYSSKCPQELVRRPLSSERRLHPVMCVYASPLRGSSSGTEQQLAISPVAQETRSRRRCGLGEPAPLCGSGAWLARRPHPAISIGCGCPGAG